MVSAPRLVQSYHRVLTAWYRLSERLAEYANLSRRLSLLMLLLALPQAWLLALAITNEAWIGVGLILVLFVAVPFFAVRPEWLVISVAFAVASLISPVFWDVLAFAERGVTLPNVLILYGLIILVFRYITSAPAARALWFTPSSIAVAVFLLLSVFTGLVYHVTVTGLPYRKELAEMQHMIMWLVYFLFIGVCTSQQTLRMLQIGILAVTAIGALPTILQAVFGEHALFFLKLTQRDIRIEQVGGLTRVIPPGENLMMMGFFVGWQMVLISSQAKRLGWLVLTTLYGIGILMTLTRHMWFGALFGLFLFWLFSSTRTKVNSIILLALLATAIASAIAFIRPISISHPDDFFARIYRRFVSTFAEQPELHTLTRASSVGQRIYEMRYIMQRFPESPWIGLGWSPRLPILIRYDPYRGDTIQSVTYVHNSFWWIVAKGGIIGTMGLLVLWMTGIIRGYQLYRRATDEMARAWLLALWVSFICLIIAGQLEPVFWIRNRIIAPALALALMETIYYFSRQKQLVQQAEPATEPATYRT